MEVTKPIVGKRYASVRDAVFTVAETFSRPDVLNLWTCMDPSGVVFYLPLNAEPIE